MRRALFTALLAAISLAACAQPQSANQTTAASGQPSIAASEAAAPPGSAAPLTAGSFDGQVLGAGEPIAKSTVTLFDATSDSPNQLAQAQAGDDGKFTFSFSGGSGILYLVATGGEPKAAKEPGNNPAIELISVIGTHVPPHVVINEYTTVASVWTMNQFINGTAIEGYPLGLRIGAGNVPNFVDLQTGGWGGAIQDSLNGPQTPTMANFATLADVLSGCVTRVTADACPSLFSAATPPAHAVPNDTLTAAESNCAISLV